MHKSIHRTWIAVAAIALGGLAACQTSEPGRNPGALPTAKTNVAPRLNASTFVAHGHLLEQQGNFAQAAEQYRHALALMPDMPAARNRLGVTLNKLGQHAQASEEFRQALARHPEATYLHNNLGFSLYLEGRYDEAERTLARAVEWQPTFRRAHMNHGLALAKLGRWDEALVAFTLAGPEPDAYYNLAVLQTEAGQFADAAHALEQALKLNPDFAEARQQLREVARLAAAEEAARAVAAIAAEVRAKETAAIAAAEPEPTVEPEPVAVWEDDTPVAAEMDAQASPEMETPVAVEMETPVVAEVETPVAMETETPVVAEMETPAVVEPEPAADIMLVGNTELTETAAMREARICRQINMAIDDLTAEMPPSTLKINEDRLIALFAELVTVMTSNTPWYDDTQRRVEQLMGVLEQPN